MKKLKLYQVLFIWGFTGLFVCFVYHMSGFMMYDHKLSSVLEYSVVFVSNVICGSIFYYFRELGLRHSRIALSYFRKIFCKMKSIRKILFILNIIPYIITFLMFCVILGLSMIIVLLLSIINYNIVEWYTMLVDNIFEFFGNWLDCVRYDNDEDDDYIIKSISIKKQRLNKLKRINGSRNILLKIKYKCGF